MVFTTLRILLPAQELLVCWAYLHHFCCCLAARPDPHLNSDISINLQFPHKSKSPWLGHPSPVQNEPVLPILFWHGWSSSSLLIGTRGKNRKCDKTHQWPFSVCSCVSILGGWPRAQLCSSTLTFQWKHFFFPSLSLFRFQTSNSSKLSRAICRMGRYCGSNQSGCHKQLSAVEWSQLVDTLLTGHLPKDTDCLWQCIFRMSAGKLRLKPLWPGSWQIPC